MGHNRGMENYQNSMPVHCPACQGDLAITRLQCPTCGTEVAGAFTLGHLASLREPHASLLELFLRVRGNMKEMERELGLSYPTVRTRLEEALVAAGLDRPGDPETAGLAAQWAAEIATQRAAELASRHAAELAQQGIELAQQGTELAQRAAEMAAQRDQWAAEQAAQRAEILDAVEKGTLTPAEAAQRLRDLKTT